MRLTKDGDGLKCSFFLCDKKEKFLQYKKCSTKIHFYFGEVYSLHYLRALHVL